MRFDLHITRSLGKSSALMCADDLSGEYVRFHQGDGTDPTKLGG